MLTTPQSNNFKLALHWLYNAKNKTLNDEVLNLQVSLHGGIRTFETAKTLIRTIMNEQQEEIIEDSKNCFATNLYSVYFTFSTNIEDIYYEKNRNIILVSPFIVDFNGFDRSILSISLKDYSLDLNGRFRKDFLNEEILHKLTNDLDYFVHKPNMDRCEEARHCFEKLPLLELMREKKYSVIGDHIFEIMIMEKYSLRPEIILEHTEYPSNRYHFKDLILDDIKMFVTEGILTSRLSVIAYRLSLWEFDVDKSISSKFYSHKLRLGKSILLYPNNLNLSFISRDIVTDRTFDGYDLRGNDEAKQIQIAKNIIENQNSRYEAEFDEETIHTVTHLSYEKINQLILERG